MYDVILLDLDGTMTDPGVGITNSVAYALRQLGEPVPPREALYPFIGPPLLDSFQGFSGLSLSRSREAVEHYHQYFQDTGIWENRVYDGIEAMLQTLQSAGKRLVLATSKPEIFSRRIMAHFGLDKYFTYIAGASMNESRLRKGQVIAYALEVCPLPPDASAIMVGDREYDVIGARENGLDTIGVLYGYGVREELEQAGAVAIAPTVEALQQMLLSE